MSRPRAVIRPGDLVFTTSTGSWLSRLIRHATGSGFSHVQLVLTPSHSPGRHPFDFEVLEVGWRIRRARFRDLGRGAFVVYRPRVPGLAPYGPEHLKWAWKLRDDVLAVLRTVPTLYPYWKLPLYLLARDWRGRLMLDGARQVCSVMAARPLVAAGWPLHVWDGNGRVEVASHDDVQSVTPGDLARYCLEGGGDLLYRSANAPLL